MNTVKDRMRDLFKRATAFLLSAAMMLSELTVLPQLTAFAAGGTIVPEITYSTGGRQPTDENNKAIANQVLIGHGDPGVTANLNIVPNISEGIASDAFYFVEIPKDVYMKFDGNAENYSIMPYDKDGALPQVSDERFNKCSTEEKYSGLVLIKTTISATAGTTLTLPVHFCFEDGVTQNESRIVKMGGGYLTYQSGSGAVHEKYDFSNAPQVDYNSSACATFTLICSNLTWDSTVKQVSHTVMWDKYNYSIFKVTMTNTSKDLESKILKYSIALKPMMAQDNDDGIGGLRDEDLMTWYYKDDTVSKNPDPQMRNNTAYDGQYIGKLDEGGVLIYDISEEAFTEGKEFWEYEDLERLSGNEIPYNVSNMRRISIERNEIIEADEGYVNTEKVEQTATNTRTFLIAVPYTNNIPLTGEETDDFGKYTEFHSTSSYNTVFYGNVGGYSWTKYMPGHEKLYSSETGFTHDKYVLVEQDDGTEEQKDELEVAIGQNASYYLGGFINTGNIPVFDSYIVDTLKDGFDLERLSVIMPKDEDGKDPVITDWFADESKGEHFAELEFKTGDSTEFVPLTSMAEGGVPADKLKDGEKAWSVSGIDTFIEEYISTNSGAEFTGRLKINFAHRIPPKAEFLGRIEVNGTATDGDVYLNSINTTYEKWIWDAIDGFNNPDGGYDKSKLTLDENTATITTVPAEPGLKVETFTPDTARNTGTLYDKELDVPINMPNSGFRYTLGNDTISDMIPGKLSTGEFLKKYGTETVLQYGLIVDRIVFSAKLLEIAEIESITLYFPASSNTAPLIKQTVSAEDFIRNLQNGDLTGGTDKWLDSSLWGDKKLLKADIEFKSFSGGVKLEDGAYIDFEGRPNYVTGGKDEATHKAPIEPNAEFTTEYNNDSFNHSATDSSKMYVTTISLEITGQSFWGEAYSAENKVTNATTKQTINSLTVPNKEENTGYTFKIKNTSRAPMGKADIVVSLPSVAMQSDGENSLVKGFLTENIEITDPDVAQIEEITLYDYNSPDPTTDDTAEGKPVKFELVDGKIIIDETAIKAAGIQRIKYIVISCSEYKGQSLDRSESLDIKLTGQSDWFDDLDAVVTVIPDNVSMKSRTLSLTDRLHVDRPTLSLEADVFYYDLKGTDQSADSSAATDKLENTLGVPYDRDFKYRVTAVNRSMSVLDDTELTITAPIKDNKTAGEENTGFHTTKIKLNSFLLDQFEEVLYVKLYEKNLGEPDEDGVASAKCVVLTYDKAAKTLSTDDKTFSVGDDDCFEISEEELNEIGIYNLDKMVIEGKKFKVSEGVQ